MRCSQTTAGSGSDALGRRMKLVGLERYNNMDESIIQAISTVGFPIVATLGLGYLLLNEQKNHKAETDSLKEAINSNTLIMTELKQLLQDKLKGE